LSEKDDKLKEMELKVTDLQENNLKQATKSQQEMSDFRGEHQRKVEDLKHEIE
jgi:hypothetical protein